MSEVTTITITTNNNNNSSMKLSDQTSAATSHKKPSSAVLNDSAAKETAILLDGEQDEAEPFKPNAHDGQHGSHVADRRHRGSLKARASSEGNVKKLEEGLGPGGAKPGPRAADEDGDDFDSEEESQEDRLRNSAYVNKLVLVAQVYVTRFCRAVNARFGGHLILLLCFLLYIVYFIYALSYRFGDESSVRLLWCTILGVIIGTRHKVASLLSQTSFGKWCAAKRSPAAAGRIKTARFFIRWLLYGGAGAFVAYVIVDVAINNPAKLKSLPGIFGYLLLCFLFSLSPSKIKWHTIYWSVVLQFIVAVMMMRWSGGKNAILWIQERLDAFFANSKSGSVLLFGETYMDHYLIFGAIPILFLTNAALSMLYYLGAMQFVIKIIGDSLQFILGTSPIESTGVAASMFMEGASAFLVLRPYLKDLNHSQLFCLVTACMASIGGAFLAILAQIGISVELMLPAMVISCPATFAVCKLMAPDTRKAKEINVNAQLPPEMQYGNILEAAQTGAISVISLVANVIVSFYTFLSLITWFNSALTWFGDRAGIYQLTMEKILSYLFYPFALMMGVDLVDCRSVAMLMGYRITSSNFLALLKMRQLIMNRDTLEHHVMMSNATFFYKGDNIILPHLNLTLIDGVINRRSEAISTYALCGFSGLLSLFISISILVTLIPNQRRWLSTQAGPLLIAGNFANFIVGCFAGLLV